MKYKIPDENTPGWLRREKKRLAFHAAHGPENAQALIEWLSEYIIDDDVEEALSNASKKEIEELIEKVSGAELPDPKALGITEDG